MVQIFIKYCISICLLQFHVVFGDTPIEWTQASIKAHNCYRKGHGVPALKFDESLCKYSQAYANKLAEEGGSLHHNIEQAKTYKFGENLYMKGKTNELDVDEMGHLAVFKWYDEIKDWDFDKSKGKGTGVTGHFTALIWKDTERVCVSYAVRKIGIWNKIYVVANYQPPGNVIGEYSKKTVPPRLDGGLKDPKCFKGDSTSDKSGSSDDGGNSGTEHTVQRTKMTNGGSDEDDDDIPKFSSSPNQFGFSGLLMVFTYIIANGF